MSSSHSATDTEYQPLERAFPRRTISEYARSDSFDSSKIRVLQLERLRLSLAGKTAPGAVNGDDAFVRRPRVGSQIPEKIQKAFDDIAKYFSEKEWEKMKAWEKIIYVYMKRKYEAMTKLGFKATLPPFMCNKRVADFQGNDFDNDPNRGNQVEHPQMTFGRLQGIFPKIMPEKPAEEGNDSKGVPEASGPQNDGKQLRPSGKLNTSEKVNKTSGPKRGKHAWTHRLRERKQLVIYEEISDPQEDDK
uniref:KRAB-related domain-containing protein n=1 Tax=Gorilla gorilla gorilla TaxID=9595 RepID=G3SGQ0_GORGO